LAGEPEAIVISSESDLLGTGETMSINAQLVDKNGNPVKRSGYQLLLSVDPLSSGVLNPFSVSLDSEGKASSEFTAGDKRSVVEISGTSSPPLTVYGTTFLIDRVMTVRDPAAPEPDPAHNSLADMGAGARPGSQQPRRHGPHECNNWK